MPPVSPNCSFYHVSTSAAVNLEDPKFVTSSPGSLQIAKMEYDNEIVENTNCKRARVSNISLRILTVHGRKRRRRLPLRPNAESA